MAGPAGARLGWSWRPGPHAGPERPKNFHFIEVFGYIECMKKYPGTSLVIQWVRLHAPNTGGPGSIPVRELDPACMPQLRSPYASTKTWHSQNK